MALYFFVNVIVHFYGICKLHVQEIPDHILQTWVCHVFVCVHKMLQGFKSNNRSIWKSNFNDYEHILTETQKPEKYTTASVSIAFCEMWSVNYIKHN